MFVLGTIAIIESKGHLLCTGEMAQRRMLPHWEFGGHQEKENVFDFYSPSFDSFFYSVKKFINLRWGLDRDLSLDVFLRQYLEKPGVEEERVGRLCVIVTVQVKITEFIQVSV